MLIDDLMMPFGDFEPVAEEAAFEMPDFMDFLVSEEIGGGFGYVLACFILADIGAIQNKQERFSLISFIISNKRTQVLYALSSLPIAKRHLHCLKRLRREDFSRNTLLRLFRLLNDPVKADAITKAKAISKILIENIERLPGWIFCPNNIQFIVEFVDIPLKVPEVFYLLPPCDTKRICASLSASSSRHDFMKRIHVWQERFIDNIPFALPSFVSLQNGLLEPILNGIELKAEGDAMGHCAYSYRDAVIAGRAFFFRWRGKERATVRLGLFKSEWRIAEIRLQDNNKPAEETKWRIAEVLVPELGAANHTKNLLNCFAAIQDISRKTHWGGN